MRDFTLLLFILVLPALAVLGHDGYIAYNNTELEYAERFYLSDLGWLWTTYSPDTFQWAQYAFTEESWTKFVDPILEQSALYIAAIPFITALVIIFIMRILGKGPFEGQGIKFGRTPGKKSKKSGSNFSFDGNDSVKGRTKYKRK